MITQSDEGKKCKTNHLLNLYSCASGTFFHSMKIGNFKHELPHFHSPSFGSGIKSSDLASRRSNFENWRSRRAPHCITIAPAEAAITRPRGASKWNYFFWVFVCLFRDSPIFTFGFSYHNNTVIEAVFWLAGTLSWGSEGRRELKGWEDTRDMQGRLSVVGWLFAPTAPRQKLIFTHS